MSRWSWRLIRSGYLTASDNMALDQALLESVSAGISEPVLRFYRWAPAAVTIGYAQPSRTVNLAACRRLGIDVVRRCTGGRAVLHGDEVTYSLIAPERGASFPADILGSYRRIADALLDALDDLGLQATLSPGRERHTASLRYSSACFITPSSYELVYDGCKITGSAQKRNGSAFLQHGSIPLMLDPYLLSCALNPDDCDHHAAAVHFKSKIGWLNRWLACPTTVSAVETALIAAFVRHFDFPMIECAPTAAELERMRQLSATRYAKILVGKAEAVTRQKE